MGRQGEGERRRTKKRWGEREKGRMGERSLCNSVIPLATEGLPKVALCLSACAKATADKVCVSS
jgi:hypothetical protein